MDWWVTTPGRATAFHSRRVDRVPGGGGTESRSHGVNRVRGIGATEGDGKGAGPGVPPCAGELGGGGVEAVWERDPPRLLGRRGGTQAGVLEVPRGGWDSEEAWPRCGSA